MHLQNRELPGFAHRKAAIWFVQKYEVLGAESKAHETRTPLGPRRFRTENPRSVTLRPWSVRAPLVVVVDDIPKRLLTIAQVRRLEDGNSGLFLGNQKVPEGRHSVPPFVGCDC
jgi:hypothetical protein